MVAAAGVSALGMASNHLHDVKLLFSYTYRLIAARATDFGNSARW
jgi:hypothetical protein